MRSHTAVFLVALSALCSAAVSAQEWHPECRTPALTDERVKQLVDQARAARSDLPKAYPQSRWEVHRNGCVYVFVEIALPEVPDRAQTVTLNEDGLVVDASGGSVPTPPPPPPRP